MKIKYTVLTGLMVIVVIIGLTGCVSKMTRLEEDYGNSFKLSKSNQILNPEAAKNLEPVYGIDGPTAEIIMDKYRGEFEKRETSAPSYLIGDIRQ